MSFKYLSKIAFGLLAGTTFSILLLPEATFAQNLNTDPSQDFQKDGDPLTGGTGQSFSVFDLIHRSNLGLNRSMEDVNNEQKENLDDAATQFRARQRQRLQVPDQLIDRVNPKTPSENTTTPNQ
ncbi:hypothetical protein IQ264_02995 [Phormidium sp. LEGE 05292]|uniref:hypothetical protein n=1 Tax=[Phormidium] sp. LEGE 05292 TaxID=767427 RepID=UPI0018818E93|nr:hypothetical protein [Phormidium sp. LEGE 05292]MBE9224441.1 hypothetical protein [Phormidium sp. LEGE 05292]